ncbi:MAG: EAL domain-containing protein [Alkalimonas sp.]|nr:EAL domain-containing protein [Alkalimonas sp.]
MTLFRQLLALILLSLTLSLAGVLWLSFDNSRAFLASQLTTDIDNTSVSLAGALQPYLDPLEPVLIESTLKAYADGGFYQQLHVTLYDTEQSWTESRELSRAGVPDWFMQLNLLPVVERRVILTSGWMQYGELTIKGHPGVATQTLWQTFIQLLSWFAMITLIIVALAALGIRKILRPLQHIHQTSERIRQHKFDSAIPLPKTRELRTVVQAINQMSQQLQQDFAESDQRQQQLKDQAFRDPVSSLANRRFFNQQLQVWLQQEPRGVLALLKLPALSQRDQQSFVERDRAIAKASQLMQQHLTGVSDALLCRLGLDEFVVILPGQSIEQSQRLLQQVQHTLQELFSNSNRSIWIGACWVNHPMSVSEAMALVDQALQQARNEDDGQVHVLTEQAEVMQRSELVSTLQQAVEHGAISFSQQPVYALLSEKSLVHYELFARLEFPIGTMLPAASFMSTLDECELGLRFDQQAIRLVLAQLRKKPEARVVLNLSAASLKSTAFQRWLRTQLQDYVDVLPHFGLECSEESVLYNQAAVQSLVSLLREFEVCFGLDRVGRNFASMAYVQQIRPDYVKIDAAFTQSLSSSPQESVFLTSLVSTIRALSIQVLAVHIEDSEQLEQLSQYRFDGYQGYVHQPEPFLQSVSEQTLSAEGETK